MLPAERISAFCRQQRTELGEERTFPPTTGKLPPRHNTKNLQSWISIPLIMARATLATPVFPLVYLPEVTAGRLGASTRVAKSEAASGGAHQRVVHEPCEHIDQGCAAVLRFQTEREGRQGLAAPEVLHRFNKSCTCSAGGPNADTPPPCDVNVWGAARETVLPGAGRRYTPGELPVFRSDGSSQKRYQAAEIWNFRISSPWLFRGRLSVAACSACGCGERRRRPQTHTAGLRLPPGRWTPRWRATGSAETTSCAVVNDTESWYRANSVGSRRLS